MRHRRTLFFVLCSLSICVVFLLMKYMPNRKTKLKDKEDPRLAYTKVSINEGTTNPQTHHKQPTTNSSPQREEKNPGPEPKYGACVNGSWWEEYQNFHGKALRAPHTRYLLFYCSGPRDGCGGFGNRMFGIVTGLYLAILTRRVFLIHWGGPDRLDNYLVPNHINWTYQREIVPKEKMHGRYWGVSGAPGWAKDSRKEELDVFEKWFASTNLSSFLSADIEAIGTIWYGAEKIWENPFLKDQASMLGLPRPDSRIPYLMLSCALRFLFKEAAAFKTHLAHARELLNMRRRPHVGIHIRTSDHHFGQSNPFSWRTKNVSRVFACATRVENTLSTKYNTHFNFTWFLAADDQKVKDNAVKRFPGKVLTIQARPGHLEYTMVSTVMRDLLTDIFLLSECDYFIGTYDSTFTTVVQGLGQFSADCVVYGETCRLDNRSIQFATRWDRTKRFYL